MKRINFIIPFIRENVKIISSYLFTLFFIGLAIWFIKHEGAELREVRPLLIRVDWRWIGFGMALDIVYVFINGKMYQSAFAAVATSVSVGDGMLLFLKRNFVSVFLPAGGVSSLAFFSGDIQKKGVSQSQINYASSIYGFVGILSVLIIAIPVFVYAVLKGTIGSGEWFSLLAVALLLTVVYLFFKSVVRKKAAYRYLVKYIPAAQVYVSEFASNQIERKHFMATLYYSLMIEVIGVVHVYIAMLALHLNVSWISAVVGYVVAVVFLVISPFLRGLGAVEASMTFIMIRLGYAGSAAVSITLIYRLMEFWVPLALGALSFLIKLNKLLMRILPAIFLLSLGLINIISVLTPAINERLVFLQNFVPLTIIAGSNYFVLVAGLFLLVTAAFMLKGLKMAWYFALVLCLFSLIGHLTKAIDYEEAIFSILVILILIASRKQYYIKPNTRLRSLGVQTTVLAIVGVLIYGCIGFYFLDQRHFAIDFSWNQAVKYTFENFLLIGSSDLVAHDPFARMFLHSINISGFLSVAFLVYTLIAPYISKPVTTTEEFKDARALVEKYGDSSLDYFKTYRDKLIFTTGDLDGFISYRIAGDFAVALEGPVANEPNKIPLIKSFDRYSLENGFKSIYYRVSQEHLNGYIALGKKMLFLGQEAVVDLTSFSLEGGNRKSIRNAVKKVSNEGFFSKVYKSPIQDGLLQKLEAVSDQWLEETKRNEFVFSQGMFIWEELKQQSIITVENAEEKIVAFLNIIPDYVKGEETYDLIRKTADAPNGVIDFIMVALFNYLRENGFKAVNIGFSPFSGLSAPHNFPERSMKFAYERIRSFSHYKGLRQAKEKFAPVWHNKYLVYEDDYDLLKMPAVLTKVFKS